MSSEPFCSEPLIPGMITTQYSPEVDIITSPKSPSEQIRILSPRCSKTHDVGGIGLGIVAALDKFSATEGKIPMKLILGTCTNSNRSDPISIAGSTTTTTTTTGYHDGGDYVGHLNRWRKVGVFYESPPSSYDNRRSAAADFRPSDFLSSCYLCRKKLHGRDIYMYRGEKAFCSTECRCRQIVMDECKEKYCGVNEVVVLSRSADISAGSSPAYLNDQLFSTGIIAI